MCTFGEVLICSPRDGGGHCELPSMAESLISPAFAMLRAVWSVSVLSVPLMPGRSDSFCTLITAANLLFAVNPKALRHQEQ